jgi:hypothetical protein
MEPEFAQWINDAASIGTSGRWAAANNKIMHLAQNPVAGEEWHLNLLSGLCCEVFAEYLRMRNAYDEQKGDTPLLAWRARNLLELSVWSTYCAKRKENARHLLKTRVVTPMTLLRLSKNGALLQNNLMIGLRA